MAKKIKTETEEIKTEKETLEDAEEILNVANETLDPEPIKISKPGPLPADWSSAATFVIGFVGPKGCGKTTACQAIAEAYNGKIVTFAERLKYIVKQVFDLTDEQVYGKEKDVQFFKPRIFDTRILKRILLMIDGAITEHKLPIKFDWRTIPANNFPSRKELKSPREIMQYVGTDVMHRVCPDFHCEVVNNSIDGAGLFLIDDLRFQSEYQSLVRNNPICHIIRISGRGEKAAGTEEHISERDWKNIVPELEIKNNSTLEKFKEKILQTTNSLLSDDILTKTGKYPNPKYIKNKRLNNVINSQNNVENGELRVGRFIFSKE